MADIFMFILSSINGEKQLFLTALDQNWHILQFLKFEKANHIKNDKC